MFSPLSDAASGEMQFEDRSWAYVNARLWLRSGILFVVIQAHLFDKAYAATHIRRE